MMGREHDKQAQFTPDHLGTKPVAYKRNKGKRCIINQMNSLMSYRRRANKEGIMMNGKSYQSNPDDRSDNVEKLQDMIENTLDNIDESEAAILFRQIKKNR